MSIAVNRQFKVRGRIACLYQPDATPETKYVPGLKVELWQKRPLNVFFLGDGLTDENGYYDISFDAQSPNVLIEEGKINEVFLKVYYGNELIIGNNPY